MSNIQEAKKSFYKRETGGVGSLQELELLWLRNNGATSYNINNAWVEYLVGQGVVRRALPDMMKAWFVSTGNWTGSINGSVSSYYEQTLENVYLFGVGNTSSLQLGEAFAGNFKGWIAGTSSEGVNPDLLAIIGGAWVDTIDLDNPVWNKISGEVTDLTYIVTSGFIGYVPSYAKDDVWVNVDMGAESTSQTTFFGVGITFGGNAVTFGAI